MNWRIGSTIISSPLKNKEKSNEKFKLFKQFNGLNPLNDLNFISVF